MRELAPSEKRIIRDPAKRRAWIIYQLNLQGRSLADVGRVEGNGAARNTVYAVFRAPYPRMEKLIADALGLRPSQLFPERYDSFGLPLRQRGTRRRAA